jgi:hypothetical protein
MSMVVTIPIQRRYADRVVASDGWNEFIVPDRLAGWRLTSYDADPFRALVVRRNGTLAEVGDVVERLDVITVEVPVRSDDPMNVTIVRLGFRNES